MTKLLQHNDAERNRVVVEDSYHDSVPYKISILFIVLMYISISFILILYFFKGSCHCIRW